MRSNAHGMVLIEALLAIVILSAGITLVVQSLSASRRNVAYSLDYTRALIILENETTKIFLNAPDQSATGEASLENSGQVYSYKTNSQAVEGQDADNLKELKAELVWKSGHRENVLAINTYTFTPPEEQQD